MCMWSITNQGIYITAVCIVSIYKQAMVHNSLLLDLKTLCCFKLFRMLHNYFWLCFSIIIYHFSGNLTIFYTLDSVIILYLCHELINKLFTNVSNIYITTCIEHIVETLFKSIAIANSYVYSDRKIFFKC